MIPEEEIEKKAETYCNYAYGNYPEYHQWSATYGGFIAGYKQALEDMKNKMPGGGIVESWG